jgi:hypothetical protein
MQGQQALDELKREFEALTQDLADSWPPPQSYPPQPAPGSMSMRSRQGSMGGVSDRLAQVLERYVAMLTIVGCYEGTCVTGRSMWQC